jgi:hypothetical protein
VLEWKNVTINTVKKLMDELSGTDYK